MCSNEVNIPPELDTLLGECDRLGMVLTATPAGGVRIEYADSTADSPTPEMVEGLKKFKPEIIKLLSESPRTQPDRVLFVARNLDCREFSRYTSSAVWVYIGQRPYYRLTPRVFYWIVDAVEKAHTDAKKNGDEAKARQLFASGVLLIQFSDYVHAHYRPDQLRRGRVAAKSGLATGPEPREV
jgi:hypothetical protein